MVGDVVAIPVEAAIVTTIYPSFQPVRRADDDTAIFKLNRWSKAVAARVGNPDFGEFEVKSHGL